MFDELKKRLNSPDSYVSLVLGLAVVLVIGMLIVNYIKGKPTTPATSEQKSETKQEQQTGLPTTHTVSQGETLWAIAEQYYKSGYNWVDIQKASNLADANVIYVGQTLTIPNATPIIPEGNMLSAATERDSKQKSYTVVAGDSLWNIAVREYGSGFKWAEIAQANKLAHPDLIYPGNVFTLP